MSPTPETYFFLSHARVAPPTDSARTDADSWVREFFRDLSLEVRRRARHDVGAEVGFLDLEVSPAADARTALLRALGSAQVFVALYSPGYIRNSWSAREQEAFGARVAEQRSPSDRLLPVLWVPFMSWEDPGEAHVAQIRRARKLAHDVPEYLENGMRGLRMLSYFEDQYRAVLGRIAGGIVDLAERAPLRPSPTPDPYQGVGVDAAFEVAVLAPATVDLPPERATDGYGETSVLWRPFGNRQALPVADDAANTAQRLGLSTKVSDYADAGGPMPGRPAVLLIDPWVIAARDGARVLSDLARELPEWVIPLIVADEEDPEYLARGAKLAGTAADILYAEGGRRPERVGQLSEFVRIMPSLIAKARRQYLKNVPVPTSTKSVKRPKLIDPDAETLPVEERP
ncbi:TIR-like protein FxsC [Phytohabitans sp. LJ34]|uniref:TIR-like protein FxsC n=1 Tax=Phytohabitans sp. LJ34 TaxID=3452217 RepID=UPI003F8BF2DD